ncbi:Maf family protein [Pelagibacterium halotolerans]|uniref:Nucleoside triphosphate pyrophosphatase n=1 Tax=Pelagibacterium halotolerans (strain DSM 22347 / JCM 15775 / CGMCC 1.7692 / B2) TaxID=1082931 RepID=G4R7Q9_PELHB|nr:Maf family protein [Pelagibacterium halotolerans]AEQ53319.1 Maf-like protein [Pelagibacterium halotolerans B2]QJR17067.1 septum formation inhibitor Maf [Pelagibacterium halotolerans]SEA63101.1 septum formation protein [Pelagibacterium halotolerans]
MLILASKSATRKTLLENAGLAFSTAGAGIDEREIENAALTGGENRAGLARLLAEAKALAVSTMTPAAFVIGADQTIAFEGHGLHKPRDRDDATERLMAMAGKSHELHSGVALARAGNIVWSTVETAVLTFKSFDRTMLDSVLDLEGAAILDSVAAYRLEGPSIRLFERIEGDYFTILGLPLLPLLAALEQYAPEVFGPRS